MEAALRKIIFVTTRLPAPPRDGHQRRTFNLLSGLCETFDVHLISFMRPDDLATGIPQLSKICKSVQTVEIVYEVSKLRFVLGLLRSMVSLRPFVEHKYFSKKLLRILQKKVEEIDPDVIHYDILPLARYIGKVNARKSVLNDHNIEHLLTIRRAKHASNPILKLFWYVESWKLKRYEKRACEMADEVIACSECDAIYLGNLSGKLVHTVPNGADCDYFGRVTRPDRSQDRLIFIGGTSWLPNRDGLEYFLNDIFPSILKQRPAVKLCLIGNSRELDIPQEVKENVEQLGFVKDFRDQVSNADVFILPLRIGSGTRLKLVEAMAMGIPIVSTTIGAEGVDLIHGESAVLVDSPDKFAESILQLLEEPNLAKQLGERARSIARNKYDWPVLHKQMKLYYQ